MRLNAAGRVRGDFVLTNIVVRSEQPGGQKQGGPRLDNVRGFAVLAIRVSPTEEDLPQEIAPVSVLPGHPTVPEDVAAVSGVSD